MNLHYSPLEEGGGKEESFPVLFSYSERGNYPDCPRIVPLSSLNEDMALFNHGQTLKRLKERGGLSPQELYANLERRSLRPMASEADSVQYLINHFKTNNHEQRE